VSQEPTKSFVETGAAARVLVVDDDAMLRSLVRMRLKKHGYTIIEASEGAQAVEIFKIERPDIVLMDASMEGMDGFEATRRLKQLDFAAKTPILMVSGLEDDESVDRAFASGASEYITKPICWPLLVHRLARICDAMRAEASILNATSEAIRANKSKSEFLANMSHELRTPMHAILSFAAMGVEKASDLQQEKILRYFNRILESGNRLLNLLNNLLDLSKLEAGAKSLQCESQSVNVILQTAMNELSSLLSSKDISVMSSDCPDELLAWCDGDQILQVFRNLLGNAIKFSNQGTVITVSMEKSHLIMPASAGGHCEAIKITVADQGLGIPEQELNSVFDKFVQSSKTKTGAGGTGLGLAITKEIVERHGGEIYAKNNADGGASFVFKLPIANPKQAAA